MEQAGRGDFAALVAMADPWTRVVVPDTPPEDLPVRLAGVGMGGGAITPFWTCR